ncbi:GAP family protein [Halegenticoccus tardaugens]|uniref:GAP family protein n=1 Tax=Halegenticoccus tardaugens TaxID=2071624 RepID=UPI00100BF96D|nr:GAP family protein [Halegenticoccus tardaugens]
MSFLTVLPLAIVMVAGPQILSAVFLATSEDWRRNSASFVLGAALSVGLLVALAYLFSNGSIERGGSSDAIHAVVLVLLLVAMAHTYLKRGESKPPKWMGTLQSARPTFAFKLGFLLLGFFPTDVLTAVSVGSYLAANRLPWTDSLPFLALTLLFLSLPSLTLLAFGERAEAFLPRARDWMKTHSWVINELVLAFFVAMVVGNLT